MKKEGMSRINTYRRLKKESKERWMVKMMDRRGLGERRGKETELKEKQNMKARVVREKGKGRDKKNRTQRGIEKER